MSASCGAVGGASGGAGRDGALTPDRREDNDNGSDYNIQVVEPGGSTPLSPQFKDLPPLPVDEKKELQRREREEGMSNGVPEPVVAAELRERTGFGNLAAFLVRMGVDVLQKA